MSGGKEAKKIIFAILSSMGRDGLGSLSIILSAIEKFWSKGNSLKIFQARNIEREEEGWEREGDKRERRGEGGGEREGG